MSASPSEAFTSGVETHSIDGTQIKVYSPEKTIADCFKFRNTVGLDVAIEALKGWRKSPRGKNHNLLMKYAKICRVEKIIRSYLEILL